VMHSVELASACLLLTFHAWKRKLLHPSTKSVCNDAAELKTKQSEVCSTAGAAEMQFASRDIDTEPPRA